MALFGLLSWTMACAPTRPPAFVGPPPPPPPPVSPYPDLDAHVKATPPEAEKSVASLAAFLVGPARSERERAWVIFRWVADNVDYDVEGFRAGEYGDLSADKVLRSRSAVCDGYSNLFDALAAAVGLESVHVSGYAKGTGYSVGRSFAAPNHAWNAVRVEGRWELVDCTWAAGSLGENGRYEKSFEPYYFMPPPEELLFTHLPLEPRWQLAAAPITMEQFLERPFVKTAYFTCGLRLPAACRATLREPGPLMELRLTAPEGTSVIGELRLNDERVAGHRVEVVREGERVIARALFPGAGTYTLRLFATKGPAWGVHQWALDLAVQALSGVPEQDLKAYDKARPRSS